ncbi:MAG: alpha/beta hydrolase fold domain-containing protein, partial [Erysipelotrichaceae bacterium]|nr:alpha/beta hydrolase fold domain-containing protein [Erysipelotrichaceae bacterium]
MKKTVIDPKQTYQNTNVDLICGQYYRNRKQYPHTGLLVEGRDVGYERYRDKYPDFPFVDKVTDVDVSLEFFETGRAEKYVPSKIESDELVVFIHGGGWWAGAVDRYRYVCKFIAKTFRRITYSIDYDLAPDFVYPHQVEQISGIIDELCQDGKKIILFGDSAGGNLALAETLKQKEHPGRIKAQILYYPCVTMSDRYDKTWDIERYGETGELERSLISRLRPADGIMASYYCKEEEREDCFNSPLYMKDHSFYP